VSERAADARAETGLVVHEAQLAEVEAKLADPHLRDEDRGELLVIKVRLVHGRVPTTELLQMCEDAIKLTSDGDNRSLAQEALATGAAVSAFNGNLSLGLERCLRVVSEPNLSIRSKNAIGVVLQRVGAFDLAADLWSEVLADSDSDSLRDPNVVVGSVLNLLSAVSRLELTLGSLEPEHERFLRVAELALDESVLPSSPASVVDISRLHRAHIAVLRGDLDLASKYWGDADSMSSHRAVMFRMYFVSIELRIALHRGDLDRAQDLVDFLLADHAASETTRLAKVEANLRQSEILAQRGEAAASVQAAMRAGQIALAERFELPRLLVDQVGEKMSLQQAEFNLLERMADLRHQLRVDRLTGLGNRRALDEGISELREATSESVSAIVLDIDYFKQVNDRYGHAVGDSVLVRVAQVLRDTAGPGVTIVRSGGDEFMVLAPTLGADLAAGIATDIHKDIRDHDWAAEGIVDGVTCSVGVAVGPSGDITDLVAQADSAMYAAKAAGKDRIVRAASTANPDGRTVRVEDERTSLAQAMRNPLFLTFAYQPVVAVASSTPDFEALARWTPHREGSPDSLGAFLAAVERLGLGDLLTELSLQHAASDLALLRRYAGASSRVAINVSSFQVSPNTVPLVDAALQSCDADDWLDVEIVENLNWSYLDEVVRIVGQLQDRGVRVHLDDFGTGTTSIELMTEVGFDGIKIDARLIAKLHESDLARRVIGGYVAACNYAGIDVTAEGVETVELANKVRRLNFTHVQGYHYARPQSIIDLVASVGTPGEAADDTVDLSLLRKEIDAFRVDNLAPSFDARLAELDALEARLGASREAQSLRALLFTRRAVLATFASRTELAVDFLDAASQVSADYGDTSIEITSMLMLAHIQTQNPDQWQAGSEALAKALHLYRRSALVGEDRARIEVMFGVIFCHLHLHDEGVRWWQRAMRSTSQQCIHTTNAALNIAESLLSSVEGRHSRLSALSAGDSDTLATAMSRLEGLEGLEEQAAWRLIVMFLRVRYLLVLDDADGASQLWKRFDDSAELPNSVQGEYGWLRARALLARACGTDEEFLTAAKELGGFFDDKSAEFRHFKEHAIRVLAEAHERSGNHAEANAAFQELLDERQEVERMRADGRLAWLEAHVDESRMFRE